MCKLVFCQTALKLERVGLSLVRGLHIVLHFVLHFALHFVRVRTEEVCTSRGVDTNVLEEC